MNIKDTTKAFLSSEFKKDYWQEKPFFMPAAIDFEDDDIDVNELAGLALEEDVESRLIEQTEPLSNLQFKLSNGPFTEDQLTVLPQSHWTLLIQAVDFYLEHFLALKHDFDFLPSWRLDDLMISISPNGGTVGPHFDQYDVFLIQASGTRKWELGQSCDEHTPLSEGNALSILKAFENQKTHECEVGDMLYIPPGVAHWGTATSDDCVTISVGFRAPSHQEISESLFDEVIPQLTESQRLKEVIELSSSTDLTANKNTQISNKQIESVKAGLIHQILNNEHLGLVLNRLMTEPKYPEQFEFISTDDAQTILDEYLENQSIVCFRPDSRIAYSELSSQLNNDSTDILVAVNGESLSIKSNQLVLDTIQTLSQNQEASITELLKVSKELTLLLIAQDSLYEV